MKIPQYVLVRMKDMEVICFTGDIGAALDFVADHVAEAGGGEAVETLTIGNNADTRHLNGSRREQNTLFFWSEEAHWTRFLSEKHYCVESRR